jgi:hypothetical protein
MSEWPRVAIAVSGSRGRQMRRMFPILRGSPLSAPFVIITPEMAICGRRFDTIYYVSPLDGDYDCGLEDPVKHLMWIRNLQVYLSLGGKIIGLPDMEKLIADAESARAGSDREV